MEKHLAGRHDQQKHAGAHEVELAETLKNIGGKMGAAGGALSGSIAGKKTLPDVHARAAGELGQRTGNALAARYLADYLAKNPNASRGQKLRMLLTVGLGGNVLGAAAGIGAGYTAAKLSPAPRISAAALQGTYGHVRGREIGESLGKNIGRVLDSAEVMADRIFNRKKRTAEIIKHLAGQHDQQRHAPKSTAGSGYEVGDIVDLDKLPYDISSVIRREAGTWKETIGKKYARLSIIQIKPDTRHNKGWEGEKAVVVDYFPTKNTSYYKIVGLTGKVRGQVKMIRPRRDIISEKSEQMVHRLATYEGLDKLDTDKVNVAVAPGTLLTLREKLRLKPAIDFLDNALSKGTKAIVTIRPIPGKPGSKGGRFANRLSVSIVNENGGKEEFSYTYDDPEHGNLLRIRDLSITDEDGKRRSMKADAYAETAFAKMIDSAISSGKSVTASAKQAPFSFWTERGFSWTPPHRYLTDHEKFVTFIESVEEQTSRVLGRDPDPLPERALLFSIDPSPIPLEDLIRKFPDSVAFLYKHDQLLDKK